MSQYTTGELARLCGVTVRTVQYYDSRKILVPSEMSEGGRRLYSDDDVKRLKIICFLRNMNVPINSIIQLFEEAHPEHVISILLEQQSEILQSEIAERQEKKEALEELQKGLKVVGKFSVESISDVAYMMENKKKLRKVHLAMLAACAPFNIAQWAAIALWIATGIWWPTILVTLLLIPVTILTLHYYWNRTEYICPECHAFFKPGKREVFFAKHTPTLRELTCTACGYKGYCVETYRREEA